MNNKKKFFTPAKIVLTVVNLLAITIFVFCGLALGFKYNTIMFVALSELAFLVSSLIVYYLFIIATSVSKIADSAIEDSEKKN